MDSNNYGAAGPFRQVCLQLLRLALLTSIFAAPMSANAAADPVPGKHALLIDVRHYAHIGHHQAGPDTSPLLRALLREGYDVRYVRDGTRREALQSLGDLALRAGREDVALVLINAGAATSERSEDIFIAFQDTRGAEVEVDGLSLRELGELLDRLATPKQLLALALYDLGEVGYTKAGADLVQPRQADSMFSARLAAQASELGGDRVVLSEWLSPGGQGASDDILSGLLAAGIRGAADSNADRVVDIAELQHFVESRSAPAPAPDAEAASTVESVAIAADAALPTRSMRLPTPQAGNAVLSPDTERQHKAVLADWVVDGLISREENLRLYTLLDNMKGKSRSEIPEECFRYYKSLEQMLQEAYLMQKTAKRDQYANVKSAKVVQGRLGSVPPACLRK